MEESEVMAKLTALHKAVTRELEDPLARYFDPPVALEFFTKWIPVRDALRKHRPSLLGDLAIRDMPSSSGTTDFDGRGYITRGFIEQLLADMQYVLDILGALPSVSVPSMKVTREGLFFAGQYFDAFREVNELIAQAKAKIVLVDGYISADTLAILSGKQAAVGVQILTKKVNPLLQVAAQAFQKQHGSLEIRTDQTFHDRFLILDDVDFFHFGASIKDLGHRGFMFSRIEEPEVTKTLIYKFNKVWSSATVAV